MKHQYRAPHLDATVVVSQQCLLAASGMNVDNSSQSGMSGD